MELKFDKLWNIVMDPLLVWKLNTPWFLVLTQVTKHIFDLVPTSF